jgi:hypothetical protein
MTPASSAVPNLPWRHRRASSLVAAVYDGRSFSLLSLGKEQFAARDYFFPLGSCLAAVAAFFLF